MNEPGNSARDHKEGREGRFKFGGSAGGWAGVGFQFAATIIVFVFLGQWLDRKLGTGWLTVAGVFLGMTAGIYSMYRRLMAEQKREDDAKRARDSGRRET
ncbi:MAG: AtpZ/AtpI family protein [Gemmatimonadaceae bacterium]